MQQMQLTPDFVNPPKPGSKYASIKCGGVYYSFPQDMLPSFQKGVPAMVDVEQNEKGYWNIKRVYATAGAPTPPANPQIPSTNYAPAVPAANNHVDEARKAENIFVCGVVNNAISHQHLPLEVQSLTQLVNMARQAWRGGNGAF